MVVPEYSATKQVFSKNLTKTDVDVRLSFPMNVLNDFVFPEGKDKVEFEVIDSTQNSWKFGLSKRNKARHPHPKPVLSSGWRSYVQAKGLKMNDRVILYTEKDKVTKTRFKIQAQRKARVHFSLFGKEIEVEDWFDVDKLKEARGYYLL